MPKKKIAERVYEWWKGEKPAAAQRSHAAGKVNRLNSGWTTQPEGANYALRVGTKVLRARARQMCGDAPHFKKFLKMVRTNVVGPHGLRLQVKAYMPDGKTLNADLNKKIETAFWNWGHKETCTLSGKMNWKAAQRLFVTHLARDGEVLVQKIRGAKNRFGFSLKFWNVDWLDEMYNDTLPSGNRVIMSVEIDADDKPVAYWLTTPSTEMMFTKRRDRTRTRVPAEAMIHAYLVTEDESQARGLTWFHAVLLQGKSMASYVEGVVTQARMTAMSLGFIEEDPAIAEQMGYDGGETATGDERVPEIDFTPGGFTTLKPGQKATQWDPKQPTQNHAEFKQSMEADLATGLDLHYFSLSGDMAAVNYSSARVGLGEERDLWREIQDFVAEMFCREVYHEWLTEAMLAGEIRLTNRDFREVQDPKFAPRGWGYVDPLKEINAASIAIENGLSSYTRELADRGIDLPDHLDELEQERKLFAEKGIPYGIPDKAAPASSDTSQPEGDTTDEEKTPKEKKAAAGGGK
jgi:lambda family phage portal protein